MPQGGAFDKLLKFFIRYRLFLSHFSPSMPRKRKGPAFRPGPNGSLSSAPGVGSQRSLSNDTPNTDTRMVNIALQDGTQSTSNSGWRPYKGRWDAKVAYRDNCAEAAPRKHTSNNGQSSRRGRQWRQNKEFEHQLNGSTRLYDGQSGRSLSPRRDPHLQPLQPQNNANWFATGNPLPESSVLNPFTMFGGLLMPMDPSVFAPQRPFFTPNLSEQLLQSQFQQPLDPSLSNFPFLPLPNGNPFIPVPPFPQASIPMKFGPGSQAAPESTLHGFHPPEAFNSGPVTDTSLHHNQNQAGPVAMRKRPTPKPQRSPSATEEYLRQSSLAPTSTSTTQPLLIILDLNGTLIFRKTRKFPPSFSRRAGLDQFLNTLVEKCKVMIWSSSQPPTVDAVCQKLFPEPKRKELVAEWGRDRLGLSKAEYNSKVQVYKTLNTVWSSKDVQASYPQNKAPPNSSARWDQTNTILIDDSKLKAVSEPYNLIEIPEFTNAQDIDETYIFPKVLQLLDILAKCDDVSKMLHVWDSKASGTGIINIDINSLQPGSIQAPQPGIEVDPAQARRDKKKARKQEKKAAKRAAAILAAKAAVMAQESSPGQNTISPALTMRSTHVQERPSTPLGSIYPEVKERSISPVSVQSENYLLDRLEESLNPQ
ncbi:NLI interacting factor-like phosphatase-domain-containing protein [Aspergillus pseudoustus]|uniref:NLI interacting factor-like phosphatase-domain-containing protein n=1 Tax=Aspergillus pseudoustus TaxID=1810923 RepID=A0ABR4KT76_9EURO